MYGLNVVAEVEFDSDIKVMPLIMETPVWKYHLWNDYEKHLSFMADSDTTYPTETFNPSGLYIDFAPYNLATTKEECYAVEKRFFFEGQYLYVHFENHNPPVIYLSLKLGKAYGFTSHFPIKAGNSVYMPDLMSFPQVVDGFDARTYSKMRFNSANINLNNTKGGFDTIPNIFGNNLSILAGRSDQEFSDYIKIAKFYISNYSFSMKEVNIEGKDRRERLSIKAPNEVYTKNEYKFIDDKFIDKVKQDAYGKCLGVSGVCLNGNQIYTDGPGSDEIQRYTFRFARKITSIDRVEVKMSDTWTEVYPGLGVPKIEEAVENVTYYQPNNPKPIVINKENGTIDVWWEQAKQEGDRSKSINEIRADGMFCPENNPSAIIKDLLDVYGNMPFSDSDFDRKEWEQEFVILNDYPVGIVLDKSDDIYSWIEKIQNGSVLGFQIYQKYGVLSVKVDTPDREPSFYIRSEFILNLDEIVVNIDAEQYATYTAINYAYNNSEQSYRSVVDKSKRDEILKIHKVDKEYSADTLLVEEAHAALKGSVLLEDFEKIRPVISGIKVFGTEWFSLSPFEIGDVELLIKPEKMPNALKRYLIVYDKASSDKIVRKNEKNGELIIREDIEDIESTGREFMGIARVQIIKRAIDLGSGITTIDVRMIEKLDKKEK